MKKNLTQEKQILTEGFLSSLFTIIFQALGIDKIVAANIIRDPEVKRQMKNVQKSLQVIQNSAKQWKEINAKDWRYRK